VCLPAQASHFPTPLGTLDAVHLVSATGWREQFEGLVFATHDAALAAAAQANGFDVIGTIRHRGPRVSGAR